MNAMIFLSVQGIRMYQDVSGYSTASNFEARVSSSLRIHLVVNREVGSSDKSSRRGSHRKGCTNKALCKHTWRYVRNDLIGSS